MIPCDAEPDRVFARLFLEDTPARKRQQLQSIREGRSILGVLYVDSLTEADGPVPTYLDLLRVTSETLATGLTPTVN